MPIYWRIEFFPPPGQRDSPSDYLDNSLTKSEKTQAVLRLNTMSQNQKGDWSHSWIHKIQDNVFQLTAGNHRFMYCLDSKIIVVVHACRKVNKKALKKDINRAIAHWNEYMSRKKGY